MGIARGVLETGDIEENVSGLDTNGLGSRGNVKGEEVACDANRSAYGFIFDAG
jgi:hypothetical protein